MPVALTTGWSPSSTPGMIWRVGANGWRNRKSHGQEGSASFAHPSLLEGAETMKTVSHSLLVLLLIARSGAWAETSALTAASSIK